MKIFFARAPFDPVTEAEMAQILACLKEEKPERIILKPSKEGYADYAQRMRMLKAAAKPWRKLTVSDDIPSGAEEVAVDASSEETVRGGRYDLAAPGIRRILIEECPYLEATVDHMCNPHRAAHSRAVAGVCRDLAKAHHMDEEQAYRAGLMHDLTKGCSDEYNRRIVAVYAPDMLSVSPKVWHSFTAPVYLHRYMGLRDRAILKAVWHHTLGDGTSPLDHILYIADKTEPTRGYDASHELDVSRRSLKEGAALVLSESKQYMREKEGLNV